MTLLPFMACRLLVVFLFVVALNLGFQQAPGTRDSNLFADEIVFEDNFDDGNLETNEKGLGSGWNHIKGNEKGGFYVDIGYEAASKTAIATVFVSNKEMVSDPEPTPGDIVGCQSSKSDFQGLYGKRSSRGHR